MSSLLRKVNRCNSNGSQRGEDNSSFFGFVRDSSYKKKKKKNEEKLPQSDSTPTKKQHVPTVVNVSNEGDQDGKTHVPISPLFTLTPDPSHKVNNVANTSSDEQSVPFDEEEDYEDIETSFSNLYQNFPQIDQEDAFLQTQAQCYNEMMNKQKQSLKANENKEEEEFAYEETLEQIKSHPKPDHQQSLSHNTQQLPPLPPSREALKNSQKKTQTPSPSSSPSSPKMKTFKEVILDDEDDQGNQNKNDDDDDAVSYSSSSSSDKNPNQTPKSQKKKRASLGIGVPDYTVFSHDKNQTAEEDATGRIGIQNPLYQTSPVVLTTSQPMTIMTAEKKTYELHDQIIPTLPLLSSEQDEIVESVEEVVARLASSTMQWTKTLVLCIQPKERKFELMRIHYPQDVTTVGDLLHHLIPTAASSSIFQDQSHIGLCRASSTNGDNEGQSNSEELDHNDERIVWDSKRLMPPEISSFHWTNIWVAIPDDISVQKCQLLGQTILTKNPQILHILSKEKKHKKDSRKKKSVQEIEEEETKEKRRKQKILKKISHRQSIPPVIDLSLYDAEERQRKHQIDKAKPIEQEIQRIANEAAQTAYKQTIKNMCQEYHISNENAQELLLSSPSYKENGNDSNLIILSPTSTKKEIHENLSPSRYREVKRDTLLLEETMDSILQTCEEAVNGCNDTDQSDERRNNNEKQNSQKCIDVLSTISIVFMSYRLLVMLGILPCDKKNTNLNQTGKDEQSPVFDLSRSLARLSPSNRKNDSDYIVSIQKSPTCSQEKNGSNKNNLPWVMIGLTNLITCFLLTILTSNRSHEIKTSNEKKESSRIQMLRLERDSQWTVSSRLKKIKK